MAVAPPPAGAHVGAENVPDPSMDHCTGPSGVMAGPGEVSATVAVQVELEPTSTGVSHATEVDVARSTACTAWFADAADVLGVPAVGRRDRLGAGRAAAVRDRAGRHGAASRSSVQVPDPNTPLPSVDQVTVPVGVNGEPARCR